VQQVGPKEDTTAEAHEIAENCLTGGSAFRYVTRHLVRKNGTKQGQNKCTEQRDDFRVPTLHVERSGGIKSGKSWHWFLNLLPAVLIGVVTHGHGVCRVFSMKYFGLSRC